MGQREGASPVQRMCDWCPGRCQCSSCSSSCRRTARSACSCTKNRNSQHNQQYHWVQALLRIKWSRLQRVSRLCSCEYRAIDTARSDAATAQKACLLREQLVKLAQACQAHMQSSCSESRWCRMCDPIYKYASRDGGQAWPGLIVQLVVRYSPDVTDPRAEPGSSAAWVLCDLRTAQCLQRTSQHGALMPLPCRVAACSLMPACSLHCLHLDQITLHHLAVGVKPAHRMQIIELELWLCVGSV